MKPSGYMQLEPLLSFLSLLLFFLRSQLGIPGAPATSAAAAVGYCPGVHDLEGLREEPLASAGKDAPGSGMADLGLCIRVGRVVEGNGARLRGSADRIPRWPKL